MPTVRPTAAAATRACSPCRPAPPGAALGSNLTNFRLDINEGTLDTPFTLSNVKLAADDEPDAAGQFVVQWAAQDARYSAAAATANASVAIYVDTDTDPTSKRLVANNLEASTGAYIWDLAATPGGITPGTYSGLRRDDRRGRLQLRQVRHRAPAGHAHVRSADDADAVAGVLRH